MNNCHYLTQMKIRENSIPFSFSRIFFKFYNEGRYKIMKATAYFPEECKELHVPNLNALPEDMLNATHNVSNKDLISCGKSTWVNGYVNGFIRGAIATLIPVAGITVVYFVQKHFNKKKEGQ